MKSIQTSINYLESITSATSRYALVYTGLCGEGYWSATRRAAAFTGPSTLSSPLLRSHREAVRALDALDRTLSTQTYTLSLPFALATYLFVSHLSSSSSESYARDGEALGAAILAGVVTSIVCGFCNGVIKDGVQTVFLVWCVDRHTPPAQGEGRERKDEVRRVFEYEVPVPEREGRQQPASRRVFGVPKRQSRMGQQQQQQRREEYPSSQIPYDDDEPPIATTAPLFVADSPPPPPPAPPQQQQQQQQSNRDLAPRSSPPLHVSQNAVIFTAEEEEDVNPFETTLPEEDIIPSLSQSHHRGGGSGSGTLSSTVLKSKQTQQEEEEEEEDVFPGSGFF